MDMNQLQQQVNQANNVQMQQQAAIGQICANVGTALFARRIEKIFGKRLYRPDFKPTKQDFAKLMEIARYSHTYGNNFGPFLAQAIGLPVRIEIKEEGEEENVEDRSEPQDPDSNIIRP